jgi:hypothetical protein
MQDGTAIHVKEWGKYDLANGHGKDGGRKDSEVESSSMHRREQWNALGKCVFYGNEMFPSRRLVQMVIP